MLLAEITPLVLTYNEEPNISRTIEKLFWAKRIVVIDSGSTDQTLAILQRYPQVEVFQNEFDSFASQCNYGLTKITSEWVLSLDADYVLSDELIEEIKGLEQHSQITGYTVGFHYCIYGRVLKGTLYPPRTVLYRKERAVYVEDGHAHRVHLDGACSRLASLIYHDDQKPLGRWLVSQDRYATLEAKKILETPVGQLGFNDRIRKRKFIAPFAVLIYCLIVNRGIFDGWAGLYYAFQRTLVEVLLSLRLIELGNLRSRDGT